MPDETTLRATPGRDSTAAEIARKRGEFRRQPHLVVTTESVPTEPVAPTADELAAKAGEAPAEKAKPKPAAKKAPAGKPADPSGKGEYGRSRLTH